MENINRYDELLIKYLINEVNTEEKDFVENWIEASKENLQHIETLRKALQLTEAKKTLDYVLDEMNVDEKWNGFRKILEENDATTVSQDAQEQIEDENGEERKSVVYRLFVSTAVAASILFVIGLGIFFFRSSPLKEPSIVVQYDKPTDSSSLSFLHHQVNTTGKDKRVQLADGSLILLANSSEITYREPFVNSREIFLNGKALFKVARDKTRPFTVSSGEISTTALGTEFTVTAFKNARQIIVRLYEGKVVVKALNKGNERMKNDVYLLPGQELVYGGPTIVVRKFIVNKHAAAERKMDEVYHENPSIPDNTKTPYFMFNHRPLNEVFDQLAEIYKVKIIYNEKDLKKLNFIGRYNTSVSVETILKRIATLNNLTISKQDSAFIISK